MKPIDWRCFANWSRAWPTALSVCAPQKLARAHLNSVRAAFWRRHSSNAATPVRWSENATASARRAASARSRWSKGATNTDRGDVMTAASVSAAPHAPSIAPTRSLCQKQKYS